MSYARYGAACRPTSETRRLFGRYRDAPMSFADACLVRIVECTDNASIMTLDSDFRIYRQAGRRVIPLLISD